MAAKTIEEGKFKVATVGPVKEGTAKSSGKAFKTYDLQFDSDQNWYNCYWVRDTAPVVGEELEGTKQEDDQFGMQFKTKWAGAGNKANWNPAGANAAVFQATATIVQGFLSLKPEHLAEWEKKRPAGISAADHYLQTVIAMAPAVKQEVIKMGGNDVQTASQTSTPPPAAGEPMPSAPPDVDNWVEGQEPGETDVDLGPM